MLTDVDHRHVRQRRRVSRGFVVARVAGELDLALIARPSPALGSEGVALLQRLQITPGATGA